MGNIQDSLPELDVPKKSTDQEGESDDSSDSSEDEKTTKKTKPPKVKVDNSWKEKDIKNLGIKLSFTNKQDALSVSECKIEKWTMEERNKHLEQILSGKDEFIASDIFEVTGPKFTLTELVTVTVTLGKDISKRHKVKVKMMKDGVWSKEDATFKKGKAIFKTKQVENFVIVGDLVTKKVKVPPEGANIKVDESSKMEVEIPAGAVDSAQDMDFQIIPPDATAMDKYLKGEKPVCKTLVGVTECLYGDGANGTTFKKPVTVKLPFDEMSKSDGEVTLVMFRMVGKEIKMMDRSTEFAVTDDSVCKLQVSSFSGYFAGFVRNECLNDVKTIEGETRLIFGKNYIATILIFREKVKMPTGFPKLWIEIVDKVAVGKTVDKRTQEGMVELPNSRSPDIKVSDGYRLRIDIVGNLKGLRDIPKSYYMITYLDVADDNHKVFTVEKKGDSSTSIGIINFYNDKGAKECVHSVQMDTIVGFDKVYRTDHKPGPKRKTDDDGVSMASKFSDYASTGTIGNDTDSMMSGYSQPPPLERKKSNMSIGSATSLMSQAPLCQALNEASLFKMAEMIKSSENGYELSVQLGLSKDFENISHSSQTIRATVFKLLKDWSKGQTNKDGAIHALDEALKAARLKKVAEVFMRAVKKNKEFEG